MASNADPISPPPSNQQPKRANRRRWVLLLAATAGITAFASLPTLVRTASSHPPDTIGWMIDFDEAARVAAVSGKPMLLKFTADWCPPCQLMKREVFPQPAVADLVRGSFVPVMVDMTIPNTPGQQIADRFGVDAIPALVVLDPGQAERARKVGYIDASRLCGWLEGFAGPSPAPVASVQTP
jgi:thiol:disulfide interchange protein